LAGFTVRAMKTEDARKYFKSVKALSTVTGLSTQAIYAWGDTVPMKWQYHFAALSKGKLKPAIPPGTRQ
jgi:hypothetical protein